MIEQAGLKGLRVGDALVSEKHAGFIVNCAKASANDVLKLITIIKEKVLLDFDVNLDCEIEIWGESDV